MKNVEPAEFFAHEKLWVDFVKRADWSRDNLAYDDPARIALRKEAGAAAKAAADAYIEKKIVARTKDPETAEALREVYAKMGDREKAEIIPYFQAKFGGFITNSMMRNIIGQTKSSFDMFDVMQNKKILFVNLSKGVL
jgi:hypothetical protein